MSWQGIKADTTDVDEAQGVSSYQLNTRMQVDGELQRRYGMLSTGLPPLDGPVLYLASGSGFVVRGTATNVEGDPDVTGIEVGPERKPPIIDVIRQGGGWLLPYGSWSGGHTYYANAIPEEGTHSCAGTITVNVDFTNPAARLLTERGKFGWVESYVVDDRTVGPGFGYQINVPWDDQFPYVRFTEFGTGLGSSTGQSIGGCG
jgi:hypothetical protein